MEEKLYSEEDLKEALFYALYVEKTNGYIVRTNDSIVREAIQAIKQKNSKTRFYHVENNQARSKCARNYSTYDNKNAK